MVGVHPGTPGHALRYIVHERALYFKSTSFVVIVVDLAEIK